MKRMFFLAAAMVAACVIISGCDLSVNFNERPDLFIKLVKLDGSSFPDVSGEISDPLGRAISNAYGEMTFLVGADQRHATVTFAWWQKTPDGTRWVSQPVGFDINQRGRNYFTITLADRALYKVAP